MDSKRWSTVVALIAIAVYFIWQTRDAFGLFFTPDDLMNLYGYIEMSWEKLLGAQFVFWSETYRPLGGVFYKSIHSAFGFKSFPFHIVLHIILVGNIVLTYALASTLTSSRIAGLCAAFLIAWHARFVDLYYSFATIYDSLSFLLCAATLLIYIRAREADRLPSIRECIAMLVLFIGALNSKEMAVTVPVLLCLYELIVKQSTKEWRIPVAGGVISAVYFVGKYVDRAKSVFANNTSYEMTFTWERWSSHISHYLRDWLILSTTPKFYWIMIGAALILALARNRRTVWATLFLLVAILPIVFLPSRSAFVSYLPFLGFVLLLSTLPRPLLLVAVIGLTYLNWKDPLYTKGDAFHFVEPNRSTADQLIALCPTLPHGARLYFKNDPHPVEYYDLTFLVRLLYGDHTIEITRQRKGEPMSGTYQYVFDYADGRYQLLKN